MTKIKFHTLEELYEDIKSDYMLNVDLVKPLCDLTKLDFQLFFHYIIRQVGYLTEDGFYVNKETVKSVIDRIQKCNEVCALKEKK